MSAISIRVATDHGDDIWFPTYGNRTADQVAKAGVALLRDDDALIPSLGNLVEEPPMPLREFLQIADALRRLLVPDANPEELAAIVSGMEAEIVEEGKP